MNPEDATQLGLIDGADVVITTATGSAQAQLAVNDRMQSGHISLPNGFGLDNADAEGAGRVGVAANELTSAADRDEIAGTPWHKYVPARVEAVAKHAG